MLPLSIFRYAKQNKNTIVRYPGENVLLMYCHHLASVVADQSFSNNQLDQMVPNLIKILCGWSSIFYTFPLVVLYKVGVLYVDWKSIAEQILTYYAMLYQIDKGKLNKYILKASVDTVFCLTQYYVLDICLVLLFIKCLICLSNMWNLGILSLLK
jgi:hypothetical protein